MKAQSLLVTVLFALASVDANAFYYDFTAAGTSQNIGGALFTNITNQPTGSGVVASFVRISDNTNIVDGYNTSTRPLANDENSSPTFTHDVLVSDLDVITENGVDYWGFYLDINQQKSDPFLSLDVLQLYIGAGDLGTAVTSAGLSGLGTLAYDLDAGGDNALKLNYALNSGSGSGDLRVLIPVLAGAQATDKVSLYSLFGATDPDNNNDGYEEWWHVKAGPPCVDNPNTPVDECVPINPNPVPEPSSLWLMGMGLLGLARFFRNQSNSVLKA